MVSAKTPAEGSFVASPVSNKPLSTTCIRSETASTASGRCVRTSYTKVKRLVVAIGIDVAEPHKALDIVALEQICQCSRANEGSLATRYPRWSLGPPSQHRVFRLALGMSQSGGEPPRQTRPLRPGRGPDNPRCVTQVSPERVHATYKSGTIGRSQPIDEKFMTVTWLPLDVRLARRSNFWTLVCPHRDTRRRRRRHPILITPVLEGACLTTTILLWQPKMINRANICIVVGVRKSKRPHPR